jgi:sugar phosphate isomerase/epimerase
MRFGAPIFGKWNGPEGWIRLLRAKGYNAAYCPVGLEASDGEIAEYAHAAQENDIVIAEAGAWDNNPLHPDRAVADAGFTGLVRAMALAEKIGALCCVNVSGSRGERWDGPHPRNLTQETFDLIVSYIGRLLDEVRPRKTAFTLEMMPWMYPTAAPEMLALIKAVGRPGFAAHVDLVNITCSPRLYFDNAATTKECFSTLGGLVKSVHAKDILLGDTLTVHLSEVRPGLGFFDYRALLTSVERCCPEAPVLLEHLASAEEYEMAAEYVRGVAASVNIQLLEPERVQ